MKKNREAFLWLTTALLSATVLIADWLTPMGVATWTLYIVPMVLLHWWQIRYAAIVFYALAATALIVVGFFISPSGISPALEVANRCLATAALWAVAIFLVMQRRAEEAARANEERLQLLIDGVKDYAIYTLDPGGTITSWNDGAARLYGYVADEIIGRHRAQLFTEHDTNKGIPQRELDLATSTGKASEEGWRRRKDGSVFWANGTMNALYREGEVTGFVKVVRDLTERKRAESELRLRERRFRSLITAISEIVWTTDALGNNSVSTPTWTEYTGLSVDEVQFLGWTKALHPDDRDQAIAQWRQSLATKVLFEIEFRVRRADGQWRHLSVRGAPILEDDGRVLEWVGICTDITERKRSELLLAAVLDHVADGIVGINERGIIQSYNLAAEKEFGYKESESIGQNVKMLMPEPYRSEHDGYLSNYLRTGKAKIIGIGRQVRARRKNGSTFPIQLTVSEFFLEGERHYTAILRDITQQLESEHALKLRDQVMQAVMQGIFITDPNREDNPIIYVNAGVEQVTGYCAEELIGKNCRLLQGKDTDPATVKVLREAIHAGRECAVEILNYKRDGTPFWVALFITPVRDNDGKLIHFVGVQADVTERRKLERAFQQAQKMEAVGRLAGGVAHDFNNLLMVISGFSDLLIQELAENSAQREMVVRIRQAGERAAGLTRQLLAFSRNQMIVPVVLDLNDVVTQAEKMLQRLIGEDVTVTAAINPGLPRVKADPGQLDQIVMNLCVNARDAMPNGGLLTIATQHVVVEAGQSGYPDLKPGSYVQLSVTDTGHGMTEEVKAQIFEPFFTTKEPGKGTGLGLATVFGIVKQSNAHISVYSEVGVGSTFKILFPAADAAPVETAATQPIVDLRGSETILLVEDEAMVRMIARIALETNGYRVIQATNGADALRKAQQHDGPIHLLLTDVVMPEMGGRQLAETLLAQHPESRVLYMSGYTDDAVVRHGIINQTDNFLQKPFAPLALAKKIREVLR